MNRWYIAFFAILVLGGGWLWASRVPAEAQADLRAPQPAVGHQAPDFTLQTLDGKTLTLEALQGTPLVLNFWATWCAPCRRELPALQAAAERYEGSVLILGIDQAEDVETVQGYVDELGLTFPIPMDTDGEVGRRYNVSGLPTTLFVDSRGTVQHVWTGEMNSITLAEAIRKIVP